MRKLSAVLLVVFSLFTAGAYAQVPVPADPVAGGDIRVWGKSVSDYIQARAGEVYNVKSYGAVGNGSTDDTAAIQATADAAATAQQTLYFPKGTYRITSPIKFASSGFAGGGQNHFNIVGDGPIQTILSCDIAATNSICVSMWLNKFFQMRDIGIQNVRPKDNRLGLVFGGPSSGTQAGQAMLERINVTGFNICFSTSAAGGGTDTSSEVLFNNFYIDNCTTGFLNNNQNGLNFFFKNLMGGFNGIGIYASTAGVHIDGGSFSFNAIDFKFTNGGISTIRNFRSENLTDVFLEQSDTDVSVRDSIALKVAPGNAEIIRHTGGGLVLENNQFTGYLNAGLDGTLILRNNYFDDPTNDVVESNLSGTTSGMGPGFHSAGFVRFESFNNYRCQHGAAYFENCQRFITGTGLMGNSNSGPMYNWRRVLIPNFIVNDLKEGIVSEVATVKTHYFQRTLGITSGNTTLIGSITPSAAAPLLNFLGPGYQTRSLIVFLRDNTTGSFQAREYHFFVEQNGTGGAWYELLPLYQTGGSSLELYALDVNATCCDGALTLRLRRTSTVAATTSVGITILTFTPGDVVQGALTTGTGGTVAGTFPGSPLTLSWLRTDAQGKTTIRGDVQYVPSATQAIALATDTITANSRNKVISNTTGGPITLTSVPTIANGTDGQVIRVINLGTQDVVLQDQGILASSNLRLAGPTVMLGPRDSIELTFLTAVGDWVQTSAGLAVATASPTTGTWAVGDKVWFAAPIAGGYIGAVCVVAGTPGTWKGFGPIAN